MSSKKDKVMEALANRKELKDGKGGPGEKKGVNLLGIVKKLTAKRKAAKMEKEEKGEKEDKNETKAEEEKEEEEEEEDTAGKGEQY